LRSTAEMSRAPTRRLPLRLLAKPAASKYCELSRTVGGPLFVLGALIAVHRPVNSAPTNCRCTRTPPGVAAPRGAVYLACVMLNRSFGEATAVIELKTGEGVPEHQVGDEYLLLDPGPEADAQALPHLQDRVKGLLVEYVDEFRQQQVLLTGEAPRRASRRVYWALGSLSLILVAALAVVLLQPESEAERIARLHEAKLCGERQTAVMRAIGRYTRDHGRPPENLEALRSGYLAEPPVDPASGLPYRYSARGDVIGLSCPNHLLAQQPSLRAGTRPGRRTPSAAGQLRAGPAAQSGSWEYDESCRAGRCQAREIVPIADG